MLQLIKALRNDEYFLAQSGETFTLPAKNKDLDFVPTPPKVANANINVKGEFEC